MVVHQLCGGPSQRCGDACVQFLLAKGLRGKAFIKEASLYLVISAGLLAVLVTAIHRLSRLSAGLIGDTPGA